MADVTTTSAARSDFRGQGIQQSGSGSFTVLRDVNIGVPNDSEKDADCLADLRITDPRDDLSRIEEAKGGLMKDSYLWILENASFRQWHNEQRSRLLWIRGDPGKGKTMLLCGIIKELEKSKKKTDLLSYFFCQATDSRINNATAVLRGLVYLLVNQQRSLISHVREKYDHARKELFEDANSWISLSKIFTNILQDPCLDSTYLIIDALDECLVDLPKLLDLLVHASSISPRVKWIVTSRNWPEINEQLEIAENRMTLSLELNAESVSAAVSKYICHRASRLAQRKRYDNKTQEAVIHHLFSNAHDTFLWVALVSQDLEKISRWNTIAKLNSFPPGLDSLYERMIRQICESADADLLKRILATVATVFQPVTLEELVSIVEIPQAISGDSESLEESAQDYTLTRALNEIFPAGTGEAHHAIFSKSLQVISRTLCRDIYNLGALGYPIEKVERPHPDPLAASRYSCIHWIDHLCNWKPDLSSNQELELESGGPLDVFMRTKFLYWLEALSLCRGMLHGVRSVARLKAFAERMTLESALTVVIQDAERFINYNKWAIEKAPLQAYASALMFSPACSLIRGLFKHDSVESITMRPGIGENWGACLQTLEGYGGVGPIAVSHDSTRIASGSRNGTIKIWDTNTGECVRIFEDRFESISSLAFSHDSSRLASASVKGVVKTWDLRKGHCLGTLLDFSGLRKIIDLDFSEDSTRLASTSNQSPVKIWNMSTSECLQTLDCHCHQKIFSHDSTKLASMSFDRSAIEIWDVNNGDRLQTIKYGGGVYSMAFSRSSARLASALTNQIIIWDISSGECLWTIEEPSRHINFSHDSTWIASVSRYDNTVKIWDTTTGMRIKILEGHGNVIWSAVFSHDSKWLASGSSDNTIKIWDTRGREDHQISEGHGTSITSVVYSHNFSRLASSSDNGHEIKIWDARSGEYVQTLKGHNDRISSVTFSHDSTRLASSSNDDTIKIWDTVGTGKCLHTFRGSDNGLDQAYSLSFSLDSAQLASASLENVTVKIWDVERGHCLQILKNHRDKDRRTWLVHYSVAFSPDSRMLSSVSDNDTVKIWDAKNGQVLQTLEGHGEWVSSLAFSHDSAWLATGSGHHDSMIHIWDISSGACQQTLMGHKSFIYAMVFSHDSARLATGSGHDDRTIKVWDVNSGNCLRTLEGHNHPVISIAFSPDSARLTSVSNDCSAKIWDTESGVCLKTLARGSKICKSGKPVAFSSSSALLASVPHYNNNTVEIWDIDSDECIRTLESYHHPHRMISFIAFSHDAVRLVFASYDDIEIWDSGSGKRLQTFENSDGVVYSTDFSNDLAQLTAVFPSGILKIWDVSSGQCLRTLRVHRDLEFRRNWGHAVAFSGDSTQLASASGDGRIKLWNSHSGECLRILDDHDALVASVAFSQDSTWLASASEDGTAMIWDPSNGNCLQKFRIGKSFRNLSFDPTGSFLHTEIGVLDIEASMASTMASTSMPTVDGYSAPRCCGLGLSEDTKWITYDSEKAIWLPSEYRPTSSVVSENEIVLGLGSGRLLIFNYHADSVEGSLRLVCR